MLMFTTIKLTVRNARNNNEKDELIMKKNGEGCGGGKGGEGMDVEGVRGRERVTRRKK